MKKLLCLSALMTIISAPAQIILYESFDYPASTAVNANTPANWATGGSGANDFTVISGNLTYSGLSDSTGNSATLGGAGLGVRRLFGSAITTGTIYFSALFKMVSMSSWTASSASSTGNGAQIGALADPSGTTLFSLQIMARTNSGGTGYELGVMKRGTGSASTFDTTARSLNDTLLIVGSYTFNNTSATDDVVKLWINPTLGGAEPAHTVMSSAGQDNATGIDRFNFRQNTATDVPTEMIWDELRVGNSWADVTPVPEPHEYALAAGIGLAGFAAWRRRRAMAA